MNIIFLWATRVFYLALIAYYAGLVALSFLLMIRLGFNKIFLARKTNSASARPVANTPRNASWRERFLYITNTNHLLNDVAAIASTVIPIYLLSISPASTFLKLSALPFIVSVIPYFFGFTRSTGVGIHGGVIGSVLGLYVLTINDTNLTWWDQTPYFLSLTLIANLSGWLGGFVGIGQIREAVAINFFELNVGEKKSALPELIVHTKEPVSNIIHSKTIGVLKVTDKKPNLITAQVDNKKGGHFSLVSLRHEIEYRVSIRPQVMLLRRLFERKIRDYSINDILDNVFNLWRHTVIRIVFLQVPKYSKPNETSINLMVLAHKETPSIIWVDDEIEDLSNALFEEINRALKNASRGDGIFDLKVKGSVTLRRWQSNIKPEQYFKNTKVSRESDTLLIDKQIRSQKIPPYIMDEFSMMETFFDRIRGSTYAFIAFLFTQIGLGVFVNWLSNQIP